MVGSGGWEREMAGEWGGAVNGRVVVGSGGCAKYTYPFLPLDCVTVGSPRTFCYHFIIRQDNIEV